MRFSTDVEAALICSGAVRSDCLFQKGQIKLGDLRAMIPFVDLVFKIEVTGDQLIRGLENGVSQYPAFEGRFPAVSGMKFEFDPRKKAGERIDLDTLIMEKRGKVQKDEKYIISTIHFLALGKDGYAPLKEGTFLTDFNTSPDLAVLVMKFFQLTHLPEIMMKWSKENGKLEHFEEFYLSRPMTPLKRKPSSLRRREELFEFVKPLIKDIVFTSDSAYIAISPSVEQRITNIYPEYQGEEEKAPAQNE
jgi:hypothetical protein